MDQEEDNGETGRALSKTYPRDSWLEYIRLGIELGTEFPEAWGKAKSQETEKSVSSYSEWLETKPVSKVNINMTIHLGYFYWPRLWKHIKCGPGVGLRYGFTRKFTSSEPTIMLKEKYLHVPMVARLVWMVEEEETHPYLELEVGLGYEFNILLSSTYQQKNRAAQVSRQERPSSGRFLVQPFAYPGSLLLNYHIYVGRIFYLGAKTRFPLEVFEDVRLRKDTSTEVLYRDILYISPLCELTIGIDVLQCLASV